MPNIFNDEKKDKKSKLKPFMVYYCEGDSKITFINKKDDNVIGGTIVICK
jgi:hypothetical protein